MSLPEPSSGTYKIISLSDPSKPAGINENGPPLPLRTVYLGAPITDWTLERVGDFLYRFRLKYPATGIEDNLNGFVITNVYQNDVVWHLTLRNAQNVFTIEPVDDQRKGWTVSVIDGSTDPKVGVLPLSLFEPDHLQFPPTQLWRFERVVLE